MKIVYWVSTSLLALALAASALSYFVHQRTIEGVRELGFPDFFRLQLGLLKLVAVVVLLLPQSPPWLREWAYAGVAFFFLTAIVAHTAHRDPVGISLISVGILVVLAISRVSLHRLLGG